VRHLFGSLYPLAASATRCAFAMRHYKVVAALFLRIACMLLNIVVMQQIELLCDGSLIVEWWQLADARCA